MQETSLVLQYTDLTGTTVSNFWYVAFMCTVTEKNLKSEFHDVFSCKTDFVPKQLEVERISMLAVL